MSPFATLKQVGKIYYRYNLTCICLVFPYIGKYFTYRYRCQ